MTEFTKEFIDEARKSITEPGIERYICIPVQLEMLDEIERLQDKIAELEAELKITDELLKEATETIGAVVACCTHNSNDDAKIGIYGIDQFIIHYNDPISASKVSVDVKTSTDNNKRSKWKAYVPGWGAPTVNKRYLVKLINNWITIATYYLRVGGGYWKDDRGQELADGVVS